MKADSFKKNNIYWSLSLLIIFILCIEYQLPRIVVSFFAFTFLVSVLPLFVYYLKNIGVVNYESNFISGNQIRFKWSNNYKKVKNDYFKNISNGIIVNDKISFYLLVDKLLDNNENSSLKVAIIDFCSITSFTNNNLVCPVLSNYSDIKLFLEKIINEISHRYDLLIKRECKNYVDYNYKYRDIRELIILINDLDYLIKKNELCNMIIRILLHGKDVGIKILMFSSYKVDNLVLDYFGDLVTIYEKVI